MKTKKIWYLSTCSTCTRIISELNITKENFIMEDIKNNPISKQDLEHIKNITNLNYGDLFNKRAMKYQKTEKKFQIKTDTDFKQAILEEYTFLKRPIIQINEKFFIGNSKKTIEIIKIELKITQ